MFSSSRHPTQDETVLLTVATRASAHVIEQHLHASLQHAHLDMRGDLLACAAELQAQTQTQTESAAARMILVASDDAALQTTLQHALGRLGCQALQAGNSESAMLILGCGIGLDLLLIHVPERGEADSLELARQAKRLLPGLQIVFMSSSQSDEPVGAANLVFGIDSLNQSIWVDALSRNISALLADQAMNAIV